MSVDQSIQEKLLKVFAPLQLKVENESAKHSGHAGVQGHAGVPTGETHYNVLVVSAKFEGQSRVERHRQVNEVLKEELERVHAMSIRALTPAEAGL